MYIAVNRNGENPLRLRQFYGVHDKFITGSSGYSASKQSLRSLMRKAAIVPVSMPVNMPVRTFLWVVEESIRELHSCHATYVSVRKQIVVKQPGGWAGGAAIAARERGGYLR